MKLAIIFPVLNQHDLANASIDFAVKLLGTNKDRELIVIDNASDQPLEGFPHFADKVEGKIVRLYNNIGVYPIFWEALKHTDADILAFFHSDLVISEKDWDLKVMEQFEQNSKLGLLGFIGSNEIDGSGGRGLGTTSNFQGLQVTHNNKKGEAKQWQGSPAEPHGKRYNGFTRAAVVDGCAMIFRRSALEQIAQRNDFPPHHFYDRLLSCEVREKGYEMGVLGIGCDHISGQTVNQEPAYGLMAEKWAREHGLDLGGFHNWDMVLYREAERMWLNEYKNQKGLVPCKL